MPTYPTQKTYRAGFYNSKKANGVDDRVYTAEDIRKPYDVIYSDGVLTEADGTAGEQLKVTATGGFNVSVSAGNAKLGGAWFENVSPFNITLDTANSTDRYDCVIIQNDDSDDVREPKIYIKSLSAVPTINDLTRTEKVYEVCVAYVRIPAFATDITDANIVDTREDGSLCNTMRGVGAMVIRTYRNTYFSQTASQKDIPIGIPQFNRSRDTLTVAVEGRVFAEGANYTVLNNTTIRLAIGLPVVGTRIDIEVAKNVNAAGAETVVQEVRELRREMTAANRKLEYDYYCNGVNDNILIGDMVRSLLRDKDDYKRVHINVIGTLGVSAEAGGKGTSAEPYYWFNFNTGSTRRAVVDFSNCGAIEPPITNGTYNVIFHSNNDIDVIGANIIANNTTQNTTVRIMNTNYGAVYFEKCRFWITAYTDSLIALRGIFTNCRGSVANIINNSYCFLPASNSVVKVVGGEYYAYTGDATKQSAIVGQSGADAVSILDGVSAPTTARSGYYQTNSLLQWAGGGIMNCTDLISALPLIVVSGISNIRGTIEKSKPNVY